MINMFSHLACVCHFVFYALPRASYGYIWCGFIPSAVWRFSNIFSSSLGVGNLALNRVFSYFLVAGMFLYLGGVWLPPCLYAPVHLYIPHNIVYPRGVNTPKCPHTLLCICVLLEALHVVGGCNGLPLCWDTSLTPPLYVSGISVCYVDISLLLMPFGGVPPISWGHQHLRCPYAHSCTFFVVHYVSCFDFGSLTTTPPVTVVSSGLSSVTVAPSLTGFPVSLDQHGVVPLPLLMPERLWRCS